MTWRHLPNLRDGPTVDTEPNAQRGTTMKSTCDSAPALLKKVGPAPKNVLRTTISRSSRNLSMRLTECFCGARGACAPMLVDSMSYHRSVSFRWVWSKPEFWGQAGLTMPKSKTLDLATSSRCSPMMCNSLPWYTTA
eukprot:6417519-Pyramimonas_sp.AAC.1